MLCSILSWYSNERKITPQKSEPEKIEKKLDLDWISRISELQKEAENKRNEEIRKNLELKRATDTTEYQKSLHEMPLKSIFLILETSKKRK